MRGQHVRAKNQPLDLITALIQDDARITKGCPPTFLKPAAPDGSRLPSARYAGKHMLIGPAWRERSINEESIRHADYRGG
jgi:hypothetical protein